MASKVLPVYSLSQFQKVLHARMQSITQKMQADIGFTTDDPLILDGAKHIATLINSPGKCIRGFVIYHMYRSTGGQDKARILQAAAAIEIFHLFALVHDDIMDRSPERRGVQTIETHTEKWLSSQNATGDIAHAATSQAILCGDYLLALSQHLLQECAFPRERQEKGQRIFHSMFTDLVLGQMLDVKMMSKRMASRKEVETKTLLKTAYYTFVHPMQLGMAFSGASQEYFDFAKEYGLSLGMGFQIQDDLFDLTLTKNQLQKFVLQDVRAGQHTVFSDYISREGSSGQKRLLATYFGQDFSDKFDQTVRQLFMESGAIAYGITQMKDCFSKAYLAVKESNLNQEDKVVWNDLIDLVAGRKS